MATEKFSEKFNETFFFFLNSYRKDILTFGGEAIEVEFNINAPTCREVFKRYENGVYANSTIISKHPNLSKAVIIAKKSWGLHVQMWSDGIGERNFTKEELVEQFTENNITIPYKLVTEFDNAIKKARDKWLFKNLI